MSQPGGAGTAGAPGAGRAALGTPQRPVCPHTRPARGCAASTAPFGARHSREARPGSHVPAAAPAALRRGEERSCHRPPPRLLGSPSAAIPIPGPLSRPRALHPGPSIPAPPPPSRRALIGGPARRGGRRAAPNAPPGSPGPAVQECGGRPPPRYLLLLQSTHTAHSSRNAAAAPP